ncbi:Bipolar DNA helicase HerA [Lacticaseibacillus paracasei subsp. paracasei]|uniref:Bipolar DNA helicase HerA n=1 Tax=Lacticaseibacillus paracasei subsp. paracasei TaxID=47714 RepID=A0AAP9HHR1_LACPA|nr:ATP-binding protein [Lacticaseibacillus paracasei]QGV18636.1 Bipolar DNA helicase HerA [Lacticaseibacillus paracasei subsp. paracasei]
MNIDSVFGTIGEGDRIHSFDKSHYYLGTVSSVANTGAKVQIENLSILQGRILNNESIYPNSVNYLILIDGERGLFLGRVNHTGIKDSESIHVLMKSGKLDQIYPEEDFDVVAFSNASSLIFSPAGFNTVGVHDKVYVATVPVITAYLNSLELLDEASGESPLKPFASLSNNPDASFELKPATLFSRHLMVIGATGSGKSTSALAILNRLHDSKIKFMMIDPTGEYRESFSEEEVHKLTLGVDTRIAPGSLTINQWIGLLEASSGIQAPALMNAIQALRFQKKQGLTGPYVKNLVTHDSIVTNIATLRAEDTAFDLSLLGEQLLQEAVQADSKGKMKPDDFKLNAIRLLTDRLNQKMETSDLRRFFSESPEYSLIEQLDHFLSGPKSIYIDASELGATDDTGGMIVDLISRYVNTHQTETRDAFVMFIDEVHRYTTKQDTEQDSYYQGLNTLAREGRKQGIYLLLTTQSPNDVSKLVLSQMGSLLIHRLTQADELYAVKNFLDDRTKSRVPYLGKGEAVLSSVNLLQNVELTIEESTRVHHNSSPSLQRHFNTSEQE